MEYDIGVQRSFYDLIELVRSRASNRPARRGPESTAPASPKRCGRETGVGRMSRMSQGALGTPAARQRARDADAPAPRVDGACGPFRACGSDVERGQSLGRLARWGEGPLVSLRCAAVALLPAARVMSWATGLEGTGGLIGHRHLLSSTLSLLGSMPWRPTRWKPVAVTRPSQSPCPARPASRGMPSARSTTRAIPGRVSAVLGSDAPNRQGGRHAA
jgi:hypothetical protein